MNDKHISSDTVKSTITATTGGQLLAGDFHLNFPFGALKTNTAVSITNIDEIPPLVDEDMIAVGVDPDCYLRAGNAYEIDIGGVLLKEPATITVQVNAKDIPKDCTLSDLKIAQYRGGAWYVLWTFFDPSTQTIHAETHQFSKVLIIGATAVLLIGGAALKVLQKRGQEGNPANIQPEEIDIRQFELNMESRQLVFPKPFRLFGRGIFDWSTLDISMPYTPRLMLDMKIPTGMCIDYAPLVASILLKMGYPIRVVPGHAVYRTEKGLLSDYHQWAEVVIDGVAFYVETVLPNPSENKDIANSFISFNLVPLSDAYQNFQLTTDTWSMWGVRIKWKELENGEYVNRSSAKYDPNWWLGYVEVYLTMLNKSKNTLFIEEGETEQDCTFEALVQPGPAVRQDCLYYSEWDFGDSKPIFRKDFDFGQLLAVTRSYTDLRNGDVLQVRVRILNEEKATVAHESMMIRVVFFEREASEDIWNRIIKAKERLETEEEALRNEFEDLRRKRNEIGKDTLEIREANHRITSQYEIIRESQRIFYDIDQEHKVWGRDKRWKSTLEIVELVLGRWSNGIMKEIAQEMDKVDSSASKWMRRIELERVSDMRNKWESVFEFTRMLFLD